MYCKFYRGYFYLKYVCHEKCFNMLPSDVVLGDAVGV